MWYLKYDIRTLIEDVTNFQIFIVTYQILGTQILTLDGIKSW